MSQTQGTLEDSPTPRPGLFERVKAVVAAPLEFLVAGALLAGVLAHIFAPAVFVSRGYLQVGEAVVPGHPFVAGPKEPLTEAIIATALNAAKQTPAGAALPSSASTALDQAAIEFGPTNNVVEIRYRASTAAAAGAMAQEIVKAYSNAVVAARTAGSAPAITVIAPPVEGKAVRNTAFEVTAVVAGAVIGIAIFVALSAMHSRKSG